MGDLLHLLCVASLMGGEKFKPVIRVQHSEERMKPEIRREIAGGCFFQERKASFTNRAKIREHGFLGVEKLKIQRDGRCAADDASFDDLERNVQPLQEGHGSGRMADDAVGGAGNGALDLAEMGYDFGGGPTAAGRAGLPQVERDEVGGVEKCRLGADELVCDAG